MSRLRLTFAAAVAFVLAWTLSLALEPRRETGILQIDPPTPFIHYFPESESRGRVLVVHGLDASKEVMRILSAALTDGGFEVYAIDLPGHGGSPAGFNAPFAEQTVRKALAKFGEDTIVVGHSLGAGLLLDLSQDQHFSKMVLLSPPPMPVSQIDADRVLLVSGALDIARIRAFAAVVADVGSSNIEWWSLTWAAHSAAIFNPIHVRRIVDWLGGDGGKTRTVGRISCFGLMLIWAIVFGAGLMPGHPVESQSIDSRVLLVRYVAACGSTLVILRFVNPMFWIRLFATDYLISLLFFTGLILWIQKRYAIRSNRIALLKAIAAAAFVVLAVGFLAASHVLHIALSNGRWWRFPIITAAGFPLLAFDEFTIRRIRPLWKSAGLAIITRVIIWACLLTGVLLLNRQDAFLVMVAHLMVLFWIGLWFAAEIVHRHTRDPIASALFAALLQGWAFAAWFVTI